LKRKKKIMVPLGVESAKDKVEVLDDIIDQLILKSRGDQ
jgi:hypothetical protein